MYSAFGASLILSQVNNSGIQIHTIQFYIPEVNHNVCLNTLVRSERNPYTLMRYTLPCYFVEPYTTNILWWGIAYLRTLLSSTILTHCWDIPSVIYIIIQVKKYPISNCEIWKVIFVQSLTRREIFIWNLAFSKIFHSNSDFHFVFRVLTEWYFLFLILETTRCREQLWINTSCIFA